MQNESAAECRFFRKAVLGSEATTGGSLQGTYVFAPSGKLLARRNSNNPNAIVETLEAGWKKWLACDDFDRQPPEASALDSGFRFEDLYPENGLILQRTARDLPVEDGGLVRPGDRFNRDALWFSRKEARSLLPNHPTAGASKAWPTQLTKRLSCLVLVDNVRGQTIPYHTEEDAGSQIWSEITSVDQELVTLRIHGETGAKAKGPWLFEGATVWDPPLGSQYAHSIETRILGNATFDTRTQRFTAFELLALGVRHGRTVNNGRSDWEPSGIGFFCELAPENWRIPPTFIDTYAVDWAASPK